MVMKLLKIKTSGLSGEINVPSSKSMSHRSLLCAALSEQMSTIHRLQTSQDIEATIRAIKAFGAEVIREGDTVYVKGSGTKIGAVCANGGVGSTEVAANDSALAEHSKQELYFQCGESGSTLRFMIPIGMLYPGQKVFDGVGGLPNRPLTEYLRNFDQLGTSYAYNGKLPFKTNEQLKAGRYQLTGGESSQYLSGLLMALPLLTEDSTIEIEGVLESKDYVALTLETLASHGIQIEVVSNKLIKIRGNQKYQAVETTVEGDYSQAAFFIVAGLLGTQPLICHHLKADSQQADKRMIEIVKRMGGMLEIQEDNLMVMPSLTKGTVIDASQCPDIIPILAVLASFSEGETRIVNGSRLRIKESDRIVSTVSLLKSIGGTVEETADGMIITGKPRHEGGRVNGFNDHRIVMAAAISAIRCEGPVWIEGAEAIDKSYPRFFEDFKALGGRVDDSDI
jgi:3-phosphoshikimate 1-carboxyvinyltransferase